MRSGPEGRRRNPAAKRRQKGIRLFHFAPAATLLAAGESGFRDEVYCAEYPGDLRGVGGTEVLLEVLLDMSAQELERYRLPVRWEDACEAQSHHYYRIPTEVLNAVGTVRRTSARRRCRRRSSSAC